MNCIERILGKISPIPAFIKNIALCSFIIVFVTIMVFLFYKKEFDKVTALAGILVGIVSSQIFSVRAELEKHTQILWLEKKYDTYKKLALYVNRMVGPLKVISLEKDLSLSPAYITEKKKEYLKGQDDFCSFYDRNHLLLSNNIRKAIHELGLLQLSISQIIEKNKLEDNKKFIDTLNKMQEQQQNILNIAQKELGVE